MALRVQNIKHSWHGRDPNEKGPGTPPRAKEQEVELKHFCRHCQKQQRKKNMGMHKAKLTPDNRFAFSRSESMLGRMEEESEDEHECDGFHDDFGCDTVVVSADSKPLAPTA
eukprot:comp8098_c0_seq1/m.3581 comp8098_c0_seq1/g.3581  ORF comp8098_c0_seq1/g.3581 comp8098_c0_seq1/m.3581 type:complete len:112 (-) comp8098_c0_seq1:246-581(-)